MEIIYITKQNTSYEFSWLVVHLWLLATEYAHARWHGHVSMMIRELIK